MEQNHLCNFERGHNGEHSCEIILNLDQWFSRRCRLKTFLIWHPLCSVDWNHLCNFGRRHHKEQSCEIILKSGPLVQEEMLFKGISYLELWQSFCSAERNHLCNFGTIL